MLRSQRSQRWTRRTPATAPIRTLRMPVAALHVRQDGIEVERLLTERAGIEPLTRRQWAARS